MQSVEAAEVLPVGCGCGSCSGCWWCRGCGFDCCSCCCCGCRWCWRGCAGACLRCWQLPASGVATVARLCGRLRASPAGWALLLPLGVRRFEFACRWRHPKFRPCWQAALCGAATTGGHPEAKRSGAAAAVATEIASAFPAAVASAAGRPLLRTDAAVAGPAVTLGAGAVGPGATGLVGVDPLVPCGGAEATASVVAAARRPAAAPCRQQWPLDRQLAAPEVRRQSEQGLQQQCRCLLGAHPQQSLRSAALLAESLLPLVAAPVKRLLLPAAV